MIQDKEDLNYIARKVLKMCMENRIRIRHNHAYNFIVTYEINKNDQMKKWRIGKDVADWREETDLQIAI